VATKTANTATEDDDPVDAVTVLAGVRPQPSDYCLTVTNLIRKIALLIER